MRRFVSLLVLVLVAATLVVDRQAEVHAQTSDLCNRGTTKQFSDVEETDYGSLYILCMKTLKLSSGRGDGSYGPAEVLTRAQMASFLVRLWRDVLGRRCSGGEAPFTDVTAGSSHADNINCLFNLGITAGITATAYGPSSKLTSSQITRFLLRTYEKAGKSCPDKSNELEEGVSCLLSINVIPSAQEGSSQRPVTRAQMAVYLVGFWHNLAGRGVPPTPPGFEESTPPTDSAVTTTTTTVSGDIRPALAVLDGLQVAPEQRSGYRRDLFAHWSDLDGDGCDTRREVLINYSQDKNKLVLDPNRTCWVVSGLWYSRYDGELVQAPSSLDIDHLVPLAEAWDSGAHAWNAQKREEFANDEGALVAVTARSNRAKGASDPPNWMPSDEEFTCPYAAAWVATKAKWNLSVDQTESDFLRQLLSGDCAGSTLNIRMPVLGFPVIDVPEIGTPELGTATTTTTTVSGPVPPNPGNTKNCSDFSTQAEAQSWYDTYFPHYGDVARLDADGDGEVCESLP